MSDWRAHLAKTDIMLVDQLMRGRVAPGTRVLDAGCGNGRNLDVFLAEGHPVLAADRDVRCVEAVHERAARHDVELPGDAVRVEAVEDLSFDDACADLVICNAVLHFANDRAHFDAQLDQLWRVLAPGGLLFTRLATTIGMESALQPQGGRWFLQPDGDLRFLLDAALLREAAERIGGTLADPLKTTVVDGQRAMSTWVLRKA